MPLISSLLGMLPQGKTTNMRASGYALWIFWEDTLDKSVAQLLQDYGGLHVTSDREQALWFFFSSDVFFALAKLKVLLSYSSPSLGIQVFHSKLLVEKGHSLSIAIDISLSNQEVLVPSNLEIWVHPKVQKEVGHPPGITFNPGIKYQGMADVEWSVIDVDLRLPYSVVQGWYFILRPIGNPLDKEFQSGWGSIYEYIENIIAKHKVKYSIFDNYLIVAIENLQQLRTWLKEILQCFLVAREEKKYWPCVFIATNKNGLSFSNDLPQKIGIKWGNLVPDVPYISYRNALLLGESFVIKDLGFSSSDISIDSWCTVSLSESGHNSRNDPIVLIPRQLLEGDSWGCFYCGLKSHESFECPTREMPSFKDVWDKLATIDLNKIQEGLHEIEKVLSSPEGEKGKYLEKYIALVSEKESLGGRITRSIFENMASVQLRNVQTFWAMGENFSISNEHKEEKDEAWVFLEKLKKTERDGLLSLEREVRNAAERLSTEFRLKVVVGFILIERGEVERAQAVWKEAESLTTATRQQVWVMFLQARGFEVMGRFAEAANIYQAVETLYPVFLEAKYRQIVCHVKMGFAEQIQVSILQFIEKEPKFFNRFFIDIELERGYVPIFTELQEHFFQIHQHAEVATKKGEKLLNALNEWFPQEHKKASLLRKKIQNLIDALASNSYTAALGMIHLLSRIEKDVEEEFKQEAIFLGEAFRSCLKRLEVIRDEAAWFPLPSILKEFNRDFNECAGILNHVYSDSLNAPEKIKKARGYLPVITDLLSVLTRRLGFLRVVRDTVLFFLILWKTFFWLEVVLLLLWIVGVPGVIFFGDSLKLGWIKTLVQEKNWGTSVIVFAISSLSLGVALLRTVFVFEKKKSQLVSDARIQRENVQNLSLKHKREAKNKKS